MRKLYVLDTSVLIHDPDSIYSFTGNDVAIPIFVIIELDDLKERKKSNVSYKSREASRRLQDIQQLGNISEGVYLEEHDITVKVIGTTGGTGIQALQENNNPRKMDLWIMKCALEQKKDYENVTLVSKDLNLRLLCQGENLQAEDYETDKVLVTELYRGFKYVEDPIPLTLMYNPNQTIRSMELTEDPVENEFYIGEYNHKQFVGYNKRGCVYPVHKEFNVGLEPRNVEQRMALHLLTDPDIQLVSLIGKAGTGKTILALAAGLTQLHSMYERIVLAKPIMDMGNSIGFLPGDLDEKLEPWMASYYDNLDKLIPTKTAYGNSKKKEPNWKYLIETEALIIQPLNSIRGRSLSDCFMIIDEAQNLTAHELKTIITRAGEGTKVILMGDPFQVDSPFLDQNSNGLTYVTQRMLGNRVFGTVFFTQGVRSKLAEEAANLL